MNRCKTCIHWKALSDGDSYKTSDIVQPYADDGHKMEMPFEVRPCKHPKLEFCERPVDNPGFAVADGSEYWAQFYTTEDFGCVLHESNGDLQRERG